MPKLIAFDLDGTLVDSAPDLAHCLGRALANSRLPQPSEAKTRAWIGDGVEALIERGLTDALGSAPGQDLLHRALAAFEACYSEHCFVRSRVYDDVVDTLESLRAAGTLVGCITNKRMKFTEPLLSRAGLSEHLDFVFGGDSCSDKKPSPVQIETALLAHRIDPSDAVVVGDSANDMLAAEAAGTKFIWARYGYIGSLQADNLEETPTISTFGELADTLISL